MTFNLPYALACPSCRHHVVVSQVDPDTSLSELYAHLFRDRAGYNRATGEQLMAKARDLTEAEVAAQ